MRIGIDVGRALHGDGGVASYTAELVRALIRHAPAEELVLFDLDRGRSRRAVYESALGSLPAAVECAPAARPVLESLDLFHAPGFVMPPAGARRTVLTLHDLTVLSHPECHTAANRVRTLSAIALALARGATVLAVSDATRREATRLLALDAGRVEVVPPVLGACFTAAAAEGDAAALRSFGLDAPFALAVAGIEPRKNLGRLLEAWDLLPTAVRGRHRLVLVTAPGWLEAGLRRRLASAASAGEILRLSRLGAPELAALYRRARVLVFPSLAEGFGLPVAEAMACGTPVVTSNRSALPETAGGAALLVDPEDAGGIAAAVARVLGDEQLRRDLRERGLERARRFVPQAVVAELLTAYRRTAGLLG
ncbi:MAG: glycosyltransferase family 4 protein [Thermoanaerobaculales bacterium]|nr:glycosyltransferase family 4 protein [Thermoanaerobaculales bacterium]